MTATIPNPITTAAATAWAEALVASEHDRQNKLARELDANAVTVELNDEQRVEKAVNLLEAVRSALPLPGAPAYVATDRVDRWVVQVTAPRAFDAGERWCALRLDALEGDFTFDHYFTKGGGLYRDGTGEFGNAVLVGEVDVPLESSAMESDVRFTAIF